MWDRPTDATPKGPDMKKLLAGVAAAAAALLALPAGTPSAQESATVMLLHGIPDTPVDLAPRRT